MLYSLILQMKLKKLFYDITLPKGSDRDEKYFFFPLHFPRESQLTVRAPHCQKQEDIVDMVARSLPYTYKLYVKEHPNHIGDVPLKAIRQIARMKDVVLLHPEAHSHRLIQKSSGVVVINSTVGFESILYQKPVVVLGRPFYSRLGLTIDVPDYFYIPEALRKALRQEEIPYEKVVAFVSSMLEAHNKGVYGDSSQQNIKAVADSVLAYLGEIRSKEKGYHEHLLNV
jgi:capsule polysaccharide modification protein KpsS